jgi:tetratricopeptide (TPR) repeat protein
MRRSRALALPDVIAMFVVVLLTALVLSNSLKNGFVHNWDDDLYVVDNPLVQDFSWQGLGRILTTVHLDYYPVTLAFFAAERALYGLNPAGYHATSLFLHCLNVCLVFYFIRLMTGRTEAAAIVALFFGIHPMHVEPVAWISSRKDLLYALFFFGALISYRQFLQDQERSDVPASSRRSMRWYAVTLALFLLSLLSKSSAVALPLVLVVLDWYAGRTFDRRCWLEKLPFALLSILFAAVGMAAQRSTGALSLAGLLASPVDRLLFASYAAAAYIVKALVPANLSAFYPYPVGPLPMEFYLAPVLLLAVVAGLWSIWRRERALRFGLLFFAAAVLPMLQLVPVGSALLADRYSYVAYVGLYFVIGHYFCRVIDGTGGWRRIPTRIAAAALVGCTVWYSSESHRRVEAWSSGDVLLSDALATHPSSAVVLLSRGIGLRKEHRTREALADLDEAIRLDPGLADAYYNRGLVYGDLRDYRTALRDFTTILRLKPDDASAHAVIGDTYDGLGDYRAADSEYTRAIELAPGMAELYNSRGVARTRLGEFQGAIRDFDRAVGLRPEYADAFNNRGVGHWRSGDYGAAVRDFSEALRLKNEFIEAGYNRGVCLAALTKHGEAADDFSRILAREPGNRKALYRRFLAFVASKRFREAGEDLTAYYRRAPNDTSMYNDLSILQAHAGSYDAALASVKRAIALDPGRASSYANLGAYLVDLGQLSAAKTNFLRAIEIDGRRWAPRLGLAVVFLELKDVRNAGIMLGEAREREPRLTEGMSGIDKLESEGYLFTEPYKEKLRRLLRPPAADPR